MDHDNTNNNFLLTKYNRNRKLICLTFRFEITCNIFSEFILYSSLGGFFL